MSKSKASMWKMSLPMGIDILKRRTMTWHLVSATEDDNGVDPMLLEAIRARKTSVDDVVSWT